LSGTGPLLLKKKSMRLEGIEHRWPGWPLRRDPRRLIPLWKNRTHTPAVVQL
jgi:hypothetical protein